MSADALPLVNMGLGLVSSTTSAYAQKQKGQAEQNAYNMNADITLDKMNQEEAASEQKFSALMGRQRSLYAAAGVDIASGSPLMVLAATAMREREDQQKIERSGTEEANLQRYQGKVAAYGGDVGAMTTFMTGLGKAGNQLMDYGKNQGWYDKSDS